MLDPHPDILQGLNPEATVQLGMFEFTQFSHAIR